ncbi:MAG TPA: hypothetical protein VFL62_07210 [Bradyrhizobium sp.]|nr:hypothetical protein [Bradyrhizobium sp.]
MPSRADGAAALRFGFAATDFDGLAADPRNALVCLFFEFLADLVAGGRPDFVARLAEAFDVAAFRPTAEGSPDFLRVFLDIRLPFVAFRRSIIAVLKQSVLDLSLLPCCGGFVYGRRNWNGI